MTIWNHNLFCSEYLYMSFYYMITSALLSHTMVHNTCAFSLRLPIAAVSLIINLEWAQLLFPSI